MNFRKEHWANGMIRRSALLCKKKLYELQKAGILWVVGK